jgi:hypothetical protein
MSPNEPFSSQREFVPRAIPAINNLSMRWLLFTLPILYCSISAKAIVLFQDRHLEADGSQLTYSFEADPHAASSMIDQKRAVKIGTNWATYYYRLADPKLLSATIVKSPAHFWLIRLTGAISDRREVVYAVVLPNGSTVDPNPTSVSRGVAEGSDLLQPRKRPEIHGEISLFYGTGRGVIDPGYYDPLFHYWRPPVENRPRVLQGTSDPFDH